MPSVCSQAQHSARGEDDVAVLLDKVAYFADDHLSDNIDVTPEGYLICRNAVIGRTGFQTYKVGEIADPEGLLSNEQRGDPEAKMDLWRDASQVFAPATIASFEGKTFTFTHPDQLLDPDTERYHHAGHVQNVRRGDPLDTGDIPLLADIIVTDRGAIEAIKGGDRELSCGYTYKLAKTGNRWDQTQILGNHVALVQKGRAGAEARIYDAAPEHSDPVAMGHPKPTFPADHVPAIRVPKGGSLCTTCRYLTEDKLNCGQEDYIKWNNSDPRLLYPHDEFCSDWYEPKPGLIHDTATDSGWKETAVNIFQKIFGLGFQAYAKDAKPEELAAALADPEISGRTKALDEKVEDIVANKNGNSNGHRKLVRIGVLRDGTAVYDEAGNPGASATVPEPAGVGPVSSKDDDIEAEGKPAMDRRKRMHDMLDNLLNKSEAGEAQKKAETDADVGELKKLMGEYLGEESGEAQHKDELPENFKKKGEGDDAEEETGDEEEEKSKDAEEEETDAAEEEEKSKDAEIVRPEPELEEAQTPKNPVGDRVVFDASATMTLLKAFRPIVASSKDKRVRAAFDTLYQGLRRAAKKGSTGRDSYARVIRAASKTAEDKITAHDSNNGKRPKESPIQKEVREADAVYASFMKNNRGLSATILEKGRSK